MSEHRETEGIEEFDARKLAYLRALANIDLLSELPETEGEIRDWERKNPDKASRLERAIDHLTDEFNLGITVVGHEEER